MLTRRTFLLASSVAALAACSGLPFRGDDELEFDGDIETLELDSQRAILLRPAEANGRLVVYHHGSGERERALLTDRLKADVVRALLVAGYSIAASDARGNNWGSAAAVGDYRALVEALPDFAAPVHFAQSMGGLTGLLSIGQGISAAGWFGIYPVCNLADMAAGPYAEAITDAGAVDNPLDLESFAFAGLPMRFYASPEDTVVAKAENTDAMVALVASVAAEAEVVECRGDHGDPSHFQPDDVLAFVGRCFA